jgi:tetratricopeptide (TPR) repeat protein
MSQKETVEVRFRLTCEDHFPLSRYLSDITTKVSPPEAAKRKSIRKSKGVKKRKASSSSSTTTTPTTPTTPTTLSPFTEKQRKRKRGTEQLSPTRKKIQSEDIAPEENFSEFLYPAKIEVYIEPKAPIFSNTPNFPLDNIPNDALHKTTPMTMYAPYETPLSYTNIISTSNTNSNNTNSGSTYSTLQEPNLRSSINALVKNLNTYDLQQLVMKIVNSNNSPLDTIIAYGKQSLSNNNNNNNINNNASPIPPTPPPPIVNPQLNPKLQISSGVEWNAKFQSALKRITQFSYNSSNEERLTAYLLLSNLAKDFIFIVRTYAKIIISEVYIPFDDKTIKPIKIGGIAGGEKYLVHNHILFKFSLQSSSISHTTSTSSLSTPLKNPSQVVDIYQSDEAAMKVTAHELKSLNHLLNCKTESFYYPMMTIIDYKGFRVVAMPVLPINSSTLIHGSSDGAKTIKYSPLVNLKLQRMASMLNLAPYTHTARNVEFYFPIDLEIHLVRSQYSFNPQLSAPSSPTSPSSPLSSPSPLTTNSSIMFSNTTPTHSPNPSTHSPHLSTPRTMMNTPSPLHYHSPHQYNNNTKEDRDENHYYLVDFSRIFPPESPELSIHSAESSAWLYRLLRPEFVRHYKTPLCSDAYSSFIKFSSNPSQYNLNVKEATNFLFTQTIPNFVSFLTSIAPHKRSQTPLLNLMHLKGINVRYLGVIYSLLHSPNDNYHHDQHANHSPYRCDHPFWSAVILIEMIARVFKDRLKKLLRTDMKKSETTSEVAQLRIILSELNSLFGSSTGTLIYWNKMIFGTLVTKFPAWRNFSYSHLTETSLQSHVFSLQLEAFHNGKHYLLKRISKLLGISFTTKIWNYYQLSSHTFNFRNPFLETDIKQLKDRVKTLHLIDQSNGFIFKYRANLTSFADEKIRFFNLAIKYLKKSLSSFPDNRDSLILLGECLLSLGNVEEATEYFNFALELGKEDSVILYKYAAYLEYMKNFSDAGAMYLAALNLTPSFSNLCSAYADYLACEERDYEKAQTYYEKAIMENKANRHAYNNYAIFLTLIMNDVTKADAIFKEGLDIPSKSRYPTHVLNYAVFLKYIKRGKEAAKKSEQYMQEYNSLIGIKA